VGLTDTVVYLDQKETYKFEGNKSRPLANFGALNSGVPVDEGRSISSGNFARLPKHPA
jgi:hypothetical protein